ncbi:MAG TPA: alpha/beta hydrolase [Aquiluna sp.]
MSKEMKAIKGFFQIRKALGLSRFGRKAKPAAKPTKSLLANTYFTSSLDFGFELNEISPKVAHDKVIIYLHGGGFVNPIATQHWQLIEKLAIAAKAKILVPRYGLAPHHDVADALEFFSKVMGFAKGFGKEIILMGDSAGGGLAVSAIQQLSLHSQISKLVLISPWLDSDFAHPGLAEVMKHDPWLIPESLRRIAAVWSGDDNHQDERVSPVRGDLAGFPKTLLFMGRWDILLFDARWFYEKATSANVDIDYQELDQALHVYPLLPTPEGVFAREKILDFLAN